MPTFNDPAFGAPDESLTDTHPVPDPVSYFSMWCVRLPDDLGLFPRYIAGWAVHRHLSGRSLRSFARKHGLVCQEPRLDFVVS